MLLIKTHTAVTNSTAVQLIKQLFASRDKNINPNVVKEALDIYNRIDGKRNYLVINALLRLYLHYNHPQNILLIWDDLEMANSNIEYDIFIQCCSKINDNLLFDFHKSMQSLSWIQQNKYYNHNLNAQKLKNYSIFVSKSVANCNTLSQLQHIDSLIAANCNQDIFIQTALINAYNKFGRIGNAFDIFNSINNSEKDGVCINGMMTGLSHNGYPRKALQIYDEHCDLQWTRNSHIFYMVAIKCCIKTNDFEKGKQIHSLNIKPSLCHNAMLATTLIDFYGHFCDFAAAENIFNAINNKKKDEFMIASMMKCLLNNGCNEKALEVYDKYPQLQDIILHSYALKACVAVHTFDRGILIIAQHLHLDDMYNDNDNRAKCKDLVNSTLIEFYGHFGCINDVMNVFDLIPENEKDVFCVGAVMKALINNNENKKALSIYDKFDNLVDDKSHVLALKACSNINEFDSGQNIINCHFANAQTQSYSIEVLTTLIDFYGNFGEIVEANKLFESIDATQKNIACVNAMMNVQCGNNLNKECIQLFHCIRDLRLNANSLSYTIALKACTQSTLLHSGMDIHSDLCENNIHLLCDLAIQICLIGMYGKCGQLEACKTIFNEIKKTDFKRYRSEIRIWNALIHAYGRNGDIRDAMKTYYIMTDGIGLGADYKTFIVLLNCCGHAGELEIAHNLWHNEISEEMKVCVVASYIDCISRKEYLKEAYELALFFDRSTMQNRETDNKMMWMTVLNACTKYKNNELSEIVYHEIKQRYGQTLKHKDFMSAASQLLSNMYA